jgi:ABC-type multidrug transport system fused ATPase/permease subunit
MSYDPSLGLKVSKIPSFIKFIYQFLGKKCANWLFLVVLLQLLLTSFDFLFLSAIYPVISNFAANVKLSETFFWSIFGDVSNKLWFNVFVLAMIVGIKNGCSQVLAYRSNKIFSRRESTIATSLFKTSLQEDMESRNSRESVDAITTFTLLANQIFESLLAPLPLYAGNVFTVITILVSLLFIQFQFALVMVFMVAIMSYGLTSFFGKLQKKIGTELYEDSRDLAKMKIESNTIAPFLILSHQVEVTSDRIWKKEFEVQHKMGLRLLLAGTPPSIMQFLILIGLGFALLFSEESGGGLINAIGLLVAAVFRVLPAVSGCIENFSKFRFGRVSLEKFLFHYESFNSPIFEEFEENSLHSKGKSEIEFFGDLVLENVGFKFRSAEKETISDLTHVFSRKTTTLVQGRSGAGKTTLLYLLTGLLQPTCGSISMVDGENIVAMGSQISGLSFVQQHVPIITGTLAQNIRGSSFLEIDPRRLHSSISQAGLSAKCDSSALGTDQFIGEDGKLLSAGERQRVGIARALYAQPKLLILDEPTANLDVATEAEIWKTIEQLKGTITIILVSHREVPENTYDSKLVLGITPQELIVI